MPRGQPDYGLYTPTPVASGISDPGEAAARLGSINIYDRRGWTVWMDDFEAPGLKWRATSSVGGTIPVLSTTRAFMGIQSVYLWTAAVAGEFSKIAKYLPLVRLGRMGIEFFVYLRTVAPGYLSLMVEIYDGANLSTAELHLDNWNRTAIIVTAAGDVTIASACFPVFGNFTWVSVKLVVDMDTDRYVRLLIGPDEYDLSAHLLVPGGATADKMIWLSAQVVGGDVASMHAYIDNFILTQNEP